MFYSRLKMDEKNAKEIEKKKYTWKQNERERRSE